MTEDEKRIALNAFTFSIQKADKPLHYESAKSLWLAAIEWERSRMCNRRRRSREH